MSAAPGAGGSRNVIGGASNGGGGGGGGGGARYLEGREEVANRYHNVIRLLRQQPAAKYFKDPVDWQKLQLWNYLEVIERPMDLSTILRKLESLEYETVAALRADVDLVWQNALTYNGPNSWIKKYIDEMRAIASKKFSEAESRPPGLARKPSGVTRAPPLSIRGVGNVPVQSGAPFFITPQMRQQLLDNVVKLNDDQRVQIGKLAEAFSSHAVETCADGRETKIDVDALEPKTFIRLDVHVRSLLAATISLTGGAP